MTRFWRGMVVLLACVALWGCAGRSAFREGQARAADGQLPEALQRYQEAMRLAPGSAEYRIAYLRTRERLVEAYLARAEAARQRGEIDAAEREYRQVLLLNGGDDRALQGVKLLEQQRRLERSVRDAEAAAARKEWDEVRQRAAAILREAPNHRRAQELLKLADAGLRPPAEAAGSPEKALAATYRKPVTIEFRDTAIKTVFEVLSRSSGLNFIFDKDVRTDQKASVFLKNSTVEAAVGMLLVSNQLEQRVLDGNTVLIYPATAAKQKDYQPLSVRSFYLAYADAKAVAATLKTLLRLRDPIVDEKLNMVMVRDTPDAISVAEKVVALHDIPEAEVMLEVEILEVKRTRLLDLGVRWPDQLSLSPLPATNGGALTLNDLRNINRDTVAVGVGPMTINARKSDTDANILANPRIRARNREKAKVHIGERIPNITTTTSPLSGFVAESVNYVDVGLKLDVEPTVYLDNEVVIKVALEVSNIISQIQTKSGTLAYQIGTRTASTVLRLKDGENQVLAGLINDEDRRSANKVPGLGEIPVLGRLFGSQADEGAKTEIVLSITPRVLRNVQRPDAAGQQFESGTDNNTGGRGPEGAPVGASSARPSGSPVPPVASSAVGTASPTATTGAGTSTGTGAENAALAGGGAAAIGLDQAALNRVITRWEAPPSVRVGEVATVRLYARSDQPVTAVQMVLGVDPAAALVTGVTEGSFLRQGNATTSFNSQVDPSGQVLVTSVRDGGSGATVEAELMSVDVRATARPANGELRLQVLNMSPVGLQGRALAPPQSLPLVIAVLP